MSQEMDALISKEIPEEVPKEIQKEATAEEQKILVDFIDKFFAFFFLLVGYAFWKVLISICNFERHVTYFTSLYVAAVLIYCYYKKLQLTKEMWFWTGIVLAIGVPYMFWSAMPELQFLVLIGTAGYWTYTVTGSLIGDGKVSEWTVVDVWNAMAHMPFSNFDKQTRVIFCTIPKRNSRKTILMVLLGVVLAVPMLMMAMPLLMQADRGFREFISGISWNLSSEWRVRIFEMLPSFMISSYLYGLLYGSNYHRIDSEKQKNKILGIVKSIRVIPNLAVNVAVTIVSALYLLFIIVQSRYFFSAFAGVRPEEYTYAEYARQGFFELCTIAAMNMVIFILTNAFSRKSYRKEKGLRISNTVLAVLTLVLIGTAMSKMGLYISAYGLTVKRILTSVFMLWMAMVFVLIIRKQRKEVKLMRRAVLAGAVLFAALCIIPIEKMIM